MHLTVFEDAGYRNLLPLTYNRATFGLRCGCDSLLRKIESAIGTTAESLFVRKQLVSAVTQRRTPRINQFSTSDDQLWVNGRLLLRQGLDLHENTALWEGDTLLAARLPLAIACKLEPSILLDPVKLKETLASVGQADIPKLDAQLINYPWQLVHANEAELVRQISGRTLQRERQVVYPGVHLLNPSAIHIGENARIKPATVLDAENGPIYLDDNVTINPHVTVQGPCYIGQGTIIQPGAAIHSGTSIGPICKIGGEIEGTIFHGYSNKQYDGFLGHSYVGEWVNLGADTVNSDFKNTYGTVRVSLNGEVVDSGEMFVGAFIGDHSKTGINVALPTGCVIGFACNIFVSRYAPKFVPSFSWLTDEGHQQNDPDRALAVAQNVMARRGQEISKVEEDLFLAIAKEAAAMERT